MISVGDHVTIGVDNDRRKIAWKVLAIDQAAPGKVDARLSSGQTGRSATVPIERLHPWAPNTKEKR